MTLAKALLGVALFPAPVHPPPLNHSPNPKARNVVPGPTTFMHPTVYLPTL